MFLIALFGAIYQKQGNVVIKDRIIKGAIASVVLTIFFYFLVIGYLDPDGWVPIILKCLPSFLLGYYWSILCLFCVDLKNKFVAR